MGVTPDIKAIKARISQQHQQLQLTTTTTDDVQPLKDKLTPVPESETSWLHVGSNGELCDT